MQGTIWQFRRQRLNAWFLTRVAFFSGTKWGAFLYLHFFPRVCVRLSVEWWRKPTNSERVNVAVQDEAANERAWNDLKA